VEKPIWSGGRDWGKYLWAVLVVCGLVVMYEFAPDARPYFAALRDHTFTLLAGCGATVVLGLIEKHLLKKPFSVRGEITVLLMFVFFAAFQAWQDEYRARQKTQTEITELTMPKLDADFSEAFGPEPADPSGVIATVMGIITNQGAPTIIEKWSFYLRLDDGREITGTPVRPPLPSDLIHIGDDNGKEIGTMRGDRHWMNSASSTPISKGGGCPGWIMFVLSNTSREEIFDKHATPFLKAWDVTGKEWTFTHPFSGRTAVSPGIKDLLVKPAGLSKSQ
jgi:hypothetical protein